jgi:hypothetical protein
MKFYSKKTFALFILFISFCSLSSLNAQVTQNYYNNSEVYKFGGNVSAHLKGNDYLIYGGSSVEKNGYRAMVRKLDTNGTEIWTTINQDTSAEFSERGIYFAAIIETNGFVYACRTNNELWKIDAQNGAILWKKNFYPLIARSTVHLFNYDSTNLVIPSLVRYDGSKYYLELFFIDKLTGAINNSVDAGTIQGESRFGFAVDSSKNLYYSKNDTIFKRSPSNLDSIAFGIKLPQNTASDFTRFHIDANDSLFLFGRKKNSHGKAIALNKSNGQILWQAQTPKDDIEFQAIVERNNKLYITWQHYYVGGANKQYRTSCINKQNGTVLWDSFFSFGSGSESAMSIDIDGNGDLFLTGYYKSSNYEPGNWGIIKINGSDGQVIYNQKIELDGNEDDIRSNGIVSAVFNNKPLFIGELEVRVGPVYRFKRVTLVELNNSTGAIVRQVTLDPGYQFPTKVIELKKTKNGILVLRQNGISVVVEKYNLQKVLQWSSTFSKDFVLLGDKICENKSGEILIAARTTDYILLPPYYGEDVAIENYYFRLDSAGNTLSELTTTGATNSFKGLRLTCSDDDFLYFQLTSSGIVGRKITPSGVSPELYTAMHMRDFVSPHFLIENDSTVFLFGQGGSSLTIKEVDKLSFTESKFDSFDQEIKYAYGAFQVGNNFLIFGKDRYSNYDKFVLYDPSTKSILWEKPLYGLTTLKLLMGPTSSNVYLASLVGSNLRISKHSTLDGTERWNYQFNRTPFDNETTIAMENQGNAIIYATLTSDSVDNNKNTTLVVEALDSSGSAINSFYKTSTSFGSELSIAQFATNDIWIGGQVDAIGGLKSGFLFQVDSSFLYPTSIFESTIGTKDFSIFPNPSKNNITLNLNDYAGYVAISIITATGNTVYQESVHFTNYKNINVEGLRKGWYVINLELENGSKRQVKMLKM